MLVSTKIKIEKKIYSTVKGKNVRDFVDSKQKTIRHTRVNTYKRLRPVHDYVTERVLNVSRS